MVDVVHSNADNLLRVIDGSQELGIGTGDDTATCSDHPKSTSKIYESLFTLSLVEK